MKAHHGAFKAAGAFQAAARPLFAGAVCRQPRLGPACGASVETEAAEERISLAELAEGPYFVLALLLDANTLCATDATCRLLRQLNRARIGPWRYLGARAFHGLELEREGTFEQPASAPELERGDALSASGRKLARIDWKGRYQHFRADVPTFCAPFTGPEISIVEHPDEVAYFRCRLCTDVIDESTTDGVYLEVEVLSNPDNLSMAVVDFEAGGCSSVTFSPDTGAVIRERKVREAPRKVEGAYIQPLPTVAPGRRFHGLMGLYLHQGRLAFFRRCDGATKPAEGAAAAEGVSAADGDSMAPPAEAHALLSQALADAELAADGGDRDQGLAPATATSSTVAVAESPGGAAAAAAAAPDGEGVPEPGPWETTGFVSDLGWAEGRRLTPCLAFRDEGQYHVRVVRVGPTPPIPLERMGAHKADKDVGWSGFDWEVGHQQPGAEGDA